MTVANKIATIKCCERCDTVGHVESQKGKWLKMSCPNCQKRWKAISERCPICKNPNGFVVPGICGHCYGERKELL
jgi:predicted amidophosphoribosyltransferase